MDENELNVITACVRKVDPKVKNLIIDILSTGSIVYQIDSEKYKLLSDSRVQQFVKAILYVLNIDLIFSPENGTVYIKNYDRQEHARNDALSDGEKKIDEETLNGTEYDVTENNTEDHFLIQKKVLSPFKSMLLVILRKYYQNSIERGATGNSVIIDLEELRSAFIPYVKASASEVKDNNKISAALEDFAKFHIVRRLKSEDLERYEIMPTIRYAVDASTLEKMLREYEKLNNKDSAAATNRGTAEDNEQ